MMNCTNCGKDIPQGTAFCPGCGAAQTGGQVSVMTTAAQGNTVSLGDWVLTLFLAAIPLVGVILLLVWGFGSGTNPSKQNYARAALIWSAGAIVLWLIAGGTLIAWVAWVVNVFLPFWR